MVEVMLATMLAGTVVAMTCGIAVHALRAESSAKAAVARRWERVRVYEQFEEDLRSALTGLPEDVQAIRINPEPGRILEVFCLAAVPDPEAFTRRRMPAKVSYVVEDAGTRDGNRKLVREVTDLTQTVPVVRRQYLTKRLTEAVVEANWGSGWSARAPAQGVGEKRPAGLRLACHWDADGGKVETRTVVIEKQREQS